MRLLDVRHEQTAAFAAEATGKLTRVPGLAVLTAGPGVTNGVSAIAQAQFAGLADGRRRRPRARTTAGARGACRSSTSRRSSRRSPSTPRTLHDRRRRRSPASHEAFTAARSSHRGPVFVDVPMDEFFNIAHRLRCRPSAPRRAGRARQRRARPDRGAARRRGAAGADPRHRRRGPTAPRRPRCASSRRSASRPSPTAWAAASSRAGTRCSSPRPAARPSAAPTWSSSSARRWTSGSATASSAARTGSTPAQVVHIADSAGQVSGHAALAGVGLRRPDRGASTACRPRSSAGRKPDWSAWVAEPPGHRRGGRRARRRALLGAEADPIHPARIYGELVPRLADDAVVIGDGGDFVSLRRQVRRAEAARRLARPRPLRLPRRRPRRGDRRPARAARRRRSCCCSATAPPASR